MLVLRKPTLPLWGGGLAKKNQPPFLAFFPPGDLQAPGSRPCCRCGSGLALGEQRVIKMPNSVWVLWKKRGPGWEMLLEWRATPYNPFKNF